MDGRNPSDLFCFTRRFHSWGSWWLRTPQWGSHCHCHCRSYQGSKQAVAQGRILTDTVLCNSSWNSIFNSNNFPTSTDCHLNSAYYVLTTYIRQLQTTYISDFLFIEENLFPQIFRTSPIILFTTLDSLKYRQNSEEKNPHISCEV